MKPKRWLWIAGLAVVVLTTVMVLALPTAKRRAESMGCGNQMIAISFVGCLLWPDEHGGFLPPDLLSMSNEIITPKILVCPGDRARLPAADWASFTSNNCSYEITGPGIRAGNSNTVFLRCLIHGHVGYGDGSVFAGKRKLRKGSW